MEIAAIVALVVLGCMFPSCLIDALKAEEKDACDKRYKAGAVFGGILLLLVLILN